MKTKECLFDIDYIMRLMKNNGAEYDTMLMAFLNQQHIIAPRMIGNKIMSYDIIMKSDTINNKGDI